MGCGCMYVRAVVVGGEKHRDRVGDQGNPGFFSGPRGTLKQKSIMGLGWKPRMNGYTVVE